MLETWIADLHIESLARSWYQSQTQSHPLNVRLRQKTIWVGDPNSGWKRRSKVRKVVGPESWTVHFPPWTVHFHPRDIIWWYVKTWWSWSQQRIIFLRHYLHFHEPQFWTIFPILISSFDFWTWMFSINHSNCQLPTA